MQVRMPAHRVLRVLVIVALLSIAATGAAVLALTTVVSARALAVPVNGTHR